ncbi:MAG: undecaprenyl diphosphate synthase family protein [Patescibacteria group bacterium]
MGSVDQEPISLTIKERFPRLEEIPEGIYPNGGYPNHVLIIPDRNRTFAKKFAQASIFGHRKGAEALEQGLLDLWELEIPNISIWGASEKNIDERDKHEMKELFQLEESMVTRNLLNLQKYGIRFIRVGRKDRLPASLLTTIQSAEKLTENNSEKTLRLLLDYGETYRQREYDKKLAQAIIDLALPPRTIATDDLIKSLNIPDIMPPVDCAIRTVGPKEDEDIDFFWTSEIGRITDKAYWFLIYKYFPEATTEDFVNAIISYYKIDKRKGGDSKRSTKNV